MSFRMLVAMLIVVHSAGFRAHQQAGMSSEAEAQELPVVFLSKVVSGKTPSGTKIQAKLSIATLSEWHGRAT